MLMEKCVACLRGRGATITRCSPQRDLDVPGAARLRTGRPIRSRTGPGAPTDTTMAAKIRCPGCGAKNDVAAYRCRICTAMINPGAAPPPAEEPPAPVGIDHFDAGDIARQVRPARERFTSTGGGLSARLAAAGGAEPERSTVEAPASSGPDTDLPHRVRGRDVRPGCALPRSGLTWEEPARSCQHEPMTTPTSPNPSPGWLRDEVDSAGRENLDPDHVARYDAKEDSGAPGDVSLLQTLGMGPDSVVVELGAGTGQFATAAAPHVRRVVAVDVSPVMLDRLRSKIRDLGIDNIDVVEAGFLTYDHTGPPADVVYSRYALHHLPDFWKALALERARTMLRSDGILRLWDVVYSFDPSEAVDRIEAWCATGGDDVDADWSRCRARGARPRRALDLHLAARTDARAGRLHHRDRGAQPGRHVRPLRRPSPVDRSLDQSATRSNADRQRSRS